MYNEWKTYDLQIEDTENGLLITQNKDAYIAKKWKASPDVIKIIDLAIKYGLSCLIQNGHPQSSKREPKGDGAEYISFARAPNEFWVMCINEYSPSNKKTRTDVNQILFKRVYRGFLSQAEVPWEIEKFRNASNIVVKIEHVEDAIKACVPYFDIYAKRGGKRGNPEKYPGFREEADLERWLMENLSEDLLNRKIIISGRQVKIDCGIIDILLEDKDSGEIIVVEVKQGRAQPVVIEEQLHRYITSKDIIDRAKVKPILGCLVAEKIEETVVNSIVNSPHRIKGYELNWKSKDRVIFNYICGDWK